MQVKWQQQHSPNFGLTGVGLQVAVHDRLAGVDAVEERVEARERRVLEELHLLRSLTRVWKDLGRSAVQVEGLCVLLGRGLPLPLCSRWG